LKTFRPILNRQLSWTVTPGGGVFFKVSLPLVRPGWSQHRYSVSSSAGIRLLYSPPGGGHTQTSTVAMNKFLASDTVHYGWAAAAALISALPEVILALLIQNISCAGSRSAR